MIHGLRLAAALVALLVASPLAPARAGQAGKGPVKVFILAGQSNMEGAGAIRGFFRPAEDSPSRHGFHWNGNAETYFLIGDSMGKAMIRLLEKP